MYSIIVIAALHEEIQIAIPSIVECLTDSEKHVRQKAINGLTGIAAYGSCPSVRMSLFDVLKDCR